MSSAFPGNRPRPKRHTAESPCPICGGWEKIRRGRGQRCHGFVSGDYVHCSREEYAHGLPEFPDSRTFAHFMKGTCKCGQRHGPDEESGQPRVRIGSPVTATVTVYDYTDESNEVLIEVVRADHADGRKTFSQRKPGGPDSIEGVRRVLYRLPELLQADPVRLVFVAEGEKCVEVLRSHGLVATCNLMGAGKWVRDGADVHGYSESLRGRNVVILPDNDDPGRKHARQVADALIGIAASVKVVPLPDLEHKGDVVDWLEAGHTGADLEALAAATPLFGEDDESRVSTLADLVASLGTSRWLWKDWVPIGELSALAANAGIGKTRLVMDICRRLYRKLPWPDGSENEWPEGSRTLWVPSDRTYRQMRDVADAYGLPHEAILLNSTGAKPKVGLTLDSAESLAELSARIRRSRPSLVIVDTVGKATQRSPHKVEDANAFYSPLMDLAGELQVAFLLVTHLNATGGAIGRRIVESVRSVMMLTQPDKDQPNRRRFWVDKTAIESPPPLGVTMSDAGNDYDLDPPTDPEEDPGPQVRVGGGGRGGNGQQARGPSKGQQALFWLRDYLSGGPAPSRTIFEDGRTCGHERPRLCEARNTLGVLVKDIEGVSCWELPDDERPF